MKKIFLIILFCLWSSSLIARDVYNEEHEGEIIYNPCGKDGKQRDTLTSILQYKDKVIYKDLNNEELKEFLIKIEQEYSDIVNVRVFESPEFNSYAIISSYLFQNFLNGKVLVELHCVKKLNNDFYLFIHKNNFEEFMGKPFTKIGIE
tara:strand:+ start:977 stop:1420 length:444 start_codon:yes stop_codon:yes gene_type:complete